MSTVKAINFQHPDAASPAITLDANGDATIPSLPSDLGDLSDVDTAGAADGEALVFSSGTWSPAEVGGLSGTSYVFVAGDGTAAENGTALDDAYTAATALTPYGNALADDNRAWVIVAPGIYDTTLEMDTQFVNVVSLDGEMSVSLTGIDVSADNVLVRGIDVGTADFLIGDDLDGLVAEKCAGGDFSFGGDTSYGENSLVVSGTFTNCTGGSHSFGGFATASGTFTNCTGEYGAFGGGNDGVASGTFVNCTGGSESFAGDGGTSSGTFTNCTAGSNAFSYRGVASGTFINCTGEGNSFGSLSAAGIASGTFVNCTGGLNSFGGNLATLTGNLLWCRLTSGSFQTPTSGGLIRLSIDGDFDEVNETAA